MGAVSVRGLGKRYRISHDATSYARLTESIAQALRHPLRRGGDKEDFWALRDVTFDFDQGDVVGVIGRNGAGKSTLLKVLARITEPTTGEAILRGRVASLLEVGTGFHPELTGRENIYLSGSILGMRRSEILRRFDEIVAFAEVDRFLDTPVKRYSSGMQVRLGFAVAAHLEADILFVDEVLAVGDLAFQEKCLGKMTSIAGQGRTVAFVSHNMGAISQLCQTSLWLEEGRVRLLGATGDVISEFVRATSLRAGLGVVDVPPDERLPAQVTRVRVQSGTDPLESVAECDQPLTIEISVDARKRLRGIYGYLEIRLRTGTTVLVSDSLDTHPNPIDELAPGQHTVSVRVPSRTLAPGTYDVVVSLATTAGPVANLHSPGVVGSFRLVDSTSLRGNDRRGFFSTLLSWERHETESRGEVLADGFDDAGRLP